MLRSCRVVSVFVLLALVLGACQPIQPVAAPAAGTAQAQLAEFPTAGVAVAVPAGWHAWYEPAMARLILSSGITSAELEALNVAQGFWTYLADEPIAIVSFVNAEPADPPLPVTEDVAQHFMSTEASMWQINPVGTTTVVNEPVALEIGGQEAARILVKGMDPALEQEFLTHGWAVNNGGRVMYVASAMLEPFEAELLPLVEQMVETLVVSAPGPAVESPLVAQGEIEPGQEVNGTLPMPPLGEVVRHYWHFTGKAGANYVATFDPVDPFIDLVTAVVDAEGNVVGEMDEGGDDVTETLAFTTTEDGDYYLSLRTWFLDPGPYTIHLEEVE